MNLLAWLKQFFSIIDTTIKENNAATAMQKRENIRTLAFHIGYAHFYSEKWEYPYTYEDRKQWNYLGQKEASKIWNSQEVLRHVALTAFIESFMEGWQAAQELNL